MNRYFLEVSYLGTRYAGFQIQPNAITIQSELEKALLVFFREPVVLTGSSRTDAGVHAQQNYFHFDWPRAIDPACVYNLNALLPGDIAVRRLVPVGPEAHSRFDALSREYRYCIYTGKDPFREGRGYYFPYTVDPEVLQQAAELVRGYTDFAAFSKKGSQAKTTRCSIEESYWEFSEQEMVYRVRANRFLRGMVRGLTGTMLQAGRGKIDIVEFQNIIESGEQARADFSVPGMGLYLEKVRYPEALGL